MVGYELPASRREAIVKEFPESGPAWIADYPGLLKTFVERWELVLKESVTIGLPINMIYLAESVTGDPRVLKIGHPHPEQLTEIKTLRFYRGRSAVQILDADETLGALLLERLDPGTTLRQRANDISNDKNEIKSAIELMQNLPVRYSVPDSAPGTRDISQHIDLPTFDRWIKGGFSEFREKYPEETEFLDYLVAAEAAFAYLESGSPQRYVLHGDLHHENILLDTQRGWVAIDPKGVIGPKILECGRFLHNFLEDELQGDSRVIDAHVDDLCELLLARYQVFGEILGYGITDLARAAFIDATLGTCWTLNNGGSAEVGIQLVRATYKLVSD